MSYTAPAFWLFLVAVLAGIALLPSRIRVLWLIGASLVFYAEPDAVRLVWLAGVAVWAIVAMRLRGPAAAPLRAGMIAGLVALLVWAKFADAIGFADPGAPPGLSFYVFTAIAMIAEAMRRGERWTVAEAFLHLAWFPKLLAGPIERPQNLIAQFSAIRLRPGMATLGLAFLLSGLIKKLVIADSLAPVVDNTFSIPEFAAPVELLIACYFFAFQIYCDFSGYADIAIGLSALVGLRIARNFDRPYFATTVSEFWSRRWHITLGHWFRDFLYIPLGGSQAGQGRRAMLLMLVFMVSGLWHAGLGYGVGWGFLIWGALNGLLVVGEVWLPRPERPVSRFLRGLLTFHLILVTWVFFRAATPEAALTILWRLAASLTELPGLLARIPFSADHWMGIVLIVALIAAEALSGAAPPAERLSRAPLAFKWTAAYGAAAVLLLLGRWQETVFIYAGF